MSKRKSTGDNRRIPVPKHPGIYQRGDKIEVRWRDLTGKVRSRTFRTLTEAVRFKGGLASGDKRPDSRMSFAAYADEWIETYEGRTSGGLSEVTRGSYRQALDKHLVPFFGKTPLERIDAPMVRRFIRQQGGAGLAPASVRRNVAPLKALLATAREDGLLTTNPAAGVRVTVPGERRVGRAHLRPEQTVALLDQIPAEHADVALLLATTGARLAEPFALRWRDLALDGDGRPMIAFPRSKTEAGLAPIPLTPETAQALMRRRAASGAGPDDLVFPGRFGGEIDPRNWRRRVFKPAACRAGVPEATPRMLRHGVATLLAEQGWTAADVGRQLRHADGGVTAARFYMHPSARTADVIETAFGKARKR